MNRILCVLLLSIFSLPLCAERKIVKHQEMKNYPAIALESALSGTIVVEIAVNSDGAITSSESSSDKKILVDASKENIQTWRFESGKEESFYVIFIFRIINPKEKEESLFDPKTLTTVISRIRPSRDR